MSENGKVKRNAIASKLFVMEDGTETRTAQAGAVAIVFKFANGATRTIDPAKASPEMNGIAVLHGFGQKFGDEYAGVADVNEAIDKFDELYEGIFERNEWTRRGESAGPQTGIVAEALNRLSLAGTIPGGKYDDLDVAQAAVKAWSKDEREQKLKVPALAKVIAEIKIERAQARLEKMEDATGDVAAL